MQYFLILITFNKFQNSQISVKANILKSYTATNKTSLYQIPKGSKKGILHLGS
jgi:hypothetical protein